MKLSRIVMLFVSFIMLSNAASAQLIGKKKNDNEIETDGKAAFDNGVQLAREDARKKLKPYKYDATKSTIFSYKTYTYAKEVELVTLEKTDYKICFNSTMVSKDKIDLEIWDKPKDKKNRILLYSESGIGGGSEVEVSLDDLNEIFRTKKKETTDLDPDLIDKMRLKKVYINYIIPAVDRELEKQYDEIGNEIKTTVIQYSAMVLAIGYLNM